jgi:uncharacterized protein
MSGDRDDAGYPRPLPSRPLSEILRAQASRRAVLVGGLATACAGFIVSGRGASASPATRIGFKPVAVEQGGGKMPAISPDYEWQVLIPWGTPLQPDGPPFRYPPSAADQARQIGIGHDGMAFFPLDAPGHGMLAVNHEYGTNRRVLGKKTPASADDVRTSQHAHGVSVVEIREEGGAWGTVKSARSRRIHVNTPVTFAGPAAGHALLANSAGTAPAGTLANCANGRTPWGTYLTCEENFHFYFAANGPWKPTEEHERYGLRAGDSGYGWQRFDPRFDLSDAGYANECNRFGWVVEIDPMDPTRAPVKRTALGRFRHEAAAVVEGRDGRIVVYMGDDERFDYIYRFVSDGNWREMTAAGRHPLDHGTLYAARFDEGNRGEWLPLTRNDPRLATRFTDQGALVTHARVAADIVGATPMDRPEWTTVAPDGDVYCSLTNNDKRQKPDPANPMTPNLYGHIIRWRDADGHTGRTFTWDFFVLAKDTHGTEATFGSPDGLWADPDGRLFIETDGAQEGGLNNQLLVADTATGEIRRLFTGVPGCEMTGLTATPDRHWLFCNVQHPGNGDPRRTNFPAAPDDVTVPRDATIAIRRKNGGIIGS